MTCGTVFIYTRAAHGTVLQRLKAAWFTVSEHNAVLHSETRSEYILLDHPLHSLCDLIITLSHVAKLIIILVIRDRKH